MAKKICLIEDTYDLLDNLTTFLKLEGFDVMPCRNGAEALKKLNQETPDLIITDLWMPVMNGFVLIDELKKIPALDHVPIAVFSAAPLQPAERQQLNSKISGYITKPITMEGLLEAINSFTKK